MPVLSIVGCKILEDEITHVLAKYRENSRIILVDDLESMGLAKKLRLLNIPFSKTPIDRVENFLGNRGKRSGSSFLSRILRSKDNSDLVVVVKIMQLGLHRDHHLLREGVEEQIVSMTGFSDGIFLFYGLCGNSLKGIEEITEGLECELYLLSDSDGNVVDDCISIAFGGNKRYERELNRQHEAATLFFTPMWAAKWESAGNMTTDMVGKNCNSFFTEKIGRVIQLDTGLQFEKEFNEKISELAVHFDAEVLKMQGSTDIVDSCYPKVRDDLLLKSKKKVS
ncbi:DUF1638 domain-containing protein [Methanolobus sp. ZRKC3]|uniref:DUF1638 domain-containing protein n=1 Tax=Methanolobus sp. ZRKC3 TaxID=3125786 RepID=UPI0032561D8F